VLSVSVFGDCPEYFYDSVLLEVVTSTILISATVIMGTGLVNWSNSNLANYQQSLADAFSSNVNKLNENLVVENVWFVSNPSKSVNVTMTNTGTIGLNRPIA
jgi:archaellum component FlaF (FlaF/FlaG flagellin family)